MRKVLKLNEKDLSRIVKRVMKENIYSQEDLEMMRDPEFQKNNYYEPVGRDLKGKIMELIHMESLSILVNIPI